MSHIRNECELMLREQLLSANPLRGWLDTQAGLSIRKANKPPT